MRKKNIGKYISIIFKDGKLPISGFLIDQNKDWILLQHNSDNFILDGYIIVRHRNIESFDRKKNDLFKERVLKLKDLQPTEKDIISMTDLSTILDQLTKKFGVFQLRQKNGKDCFLGSLASFGNKSFVIDPLLPNGKWGKKTLFFEKNLRTIQFATDYITSLLLVNSDNMLLLEQKLQKN